MGQASSEVGEGNVHANYGEHQEAIAEYSKAIAHDPGYVVAYNNRGLSENNIGKYQEAIADFDLALKLDPKFTEAYVNRGDAKCKLAASLVG
jgi:tetratricopeptide (TPR) repeat protein